MKHHLAFALELGLVTLFSLCMQLAIYAMVQVIDQWPTTIYRRTSIGIWFDYGTEELPF